LALATVSLVLFLTFLDNTVVSVALAGIQTDLHAGVTALQWVVSGYALTFAGLMLTFGALADMFGRRAIMASGIAIFCAGSVLGALATSPGLLIAGRVVMGVGAAASEPGTLSMIRHLYREEAERDQALGVWAAVSGLALAMGPVVGGVLIGVWSWRAVFWFNLVLGVLALVGTLAILPENSDPDTHQVDFAGFVLGAGALACATFATILGETAGYATAEIVALYAVGVGLGITFVLVERRASYPVLDVRFFRNPVFSGANFVAFSTYLGTFALFFFVPLYLQLVGSSSGFDLALDFIPMAAALVLASAFTGRWVASVGPRIPMVTGCLMASAGLIATELVVTPTSGPLQLAWTFALAGAGFGVAVVPVTASVLSVVPPARSGMAASATNTSRELGAVAGVAVLGAIVNAQLTTHLAHRLAAIGVPASLRAQVITAVTTGTAGQQASQFDPRSAIGQIVQKVIHAAYGAFTHGLSLALVTASILMLVSAVVATATMGAWRPANDA